MTQATRSISVTDTAKYVRTALKESFPGIKFSVTSKSYAGGASIRISWMDGPTSDEVEAVTHKFQGASFDGSIDLKSYHDGELNGESVHFGADYVNCDRSLSEAFLTKVATWYCKRFGYPMPAIRVSSYDGSASIDSNFHNGHDYLPTLIYREYRQISARDVDDIDGFFARLEAEKEAEYQAYMAEKAAREQEEMPVQEEEEDRATYLETELLPKLRAQVAGFQQMGADHAVEIVSKAIARHEQELATLKPESIAQMGTTLVTVIQELGDNQHQVRVLPAGAMTALRLTISGELAFYLKRYTATLVDGQTFDRVLDARVALNTSKVA